MTVTQTNIVKEVEKLKWMRILLILASFAVGIVLIRLGQVRVAILEVGAVMLVGGIGYSYLRKAVVRSVSSKTGRSVDQLLEELKKNRA